MSLTVYRQQYTTPRFIIPRYNVNINIDTSLNHSSFKNHYYRIGVGLQVVYEQTRPVSDQAVLATELVLAVDTRRLT